jgi:hypothetical protein
MKLYIPKIWVFVSLLSWRSWFFVVRLVFVHEYPSSEITPSLRHFQSRSQPHKGTFISLSLWRGELNIYIADHILALPDGNFYFMCLFAGSIRLKMPSFFIHSYHVKLLVVKNRVCRFQWPSGLRRSSTDSRLLGLRVRIPVGHECVSLVSVLCCEVEVSATGRFLVHRSPTDCGVSEYVIRNLDDQPALVRVGLLSQYRLRVLLCVCVCVC